MTWEIAVVFVLLVGALASFIAERVSIDVTALTVYAILLGLAMLPGSHHFPDVHQLLGVLSNPAPLTVAAMFILSAALEKTGAIDHLAGALESIAGWGYRTCLVLMILTAAFCSAFINNTPVVVVFVPVVLRLSRRLQVPASKILIPLSYAAILGGCCTLLGTSTNILASGIMEARGLPALGMFELSPIGLPLLGIGVLFLAFFGDRLLPGREPLSAILAEGERREFLTEAILPRGSKAVGKTPREAGLLRTRGIHLLEIIRDHQPVPTAEMAGLPLCEGDLLTLSCRPSGFAHTRAIDGIDLAIEHELGLETVSAHEGSIVEGVIGPASPLIGKTLREANFRSRYRMIPLAIHRRGANLSHQIRRMPLEFGDILLLMGTDQAREELRQSSDILLLDRPATVSRGRAAKLPLVLAAIVAVVTLSATEVFPIAAVAIMGVVFLFLTGCVKPKEGYAAIDWQTLVLIYGMLGLGTAMETTGGANWLASNLIDGLAAVVPPDLKPLAVLAAIYLATLMLTEVLSNNAAVALMAPIALGLAETLGLEPRPFVLAACIASSAAFAVPFGYQTHAYVYGIGGYKFTDFLRVGLPLDFLTAGTAITILALRFF